MLNLTMTRRVTSKRVNIRAKVNIIMCVGMSRGLLIIMHGSGLALQEGSCEWTLDAAIRSLVQQTRWPDFQTKSICAIMLHNVHIN